VPSELWEKFLPLWFYVTVKNMTSLNVRLAFLLKHNNQSGGLILTIRLKNGQIMLKRVKKKHR